MRLQSLALLAGASVVAADSTITLFLPGFDTQSIEGKILGSSGSMTTYLLNCPAGEDSSQCGLPPDGYSITEGASSIEMGYSYGPQTFSQSCKLQGITYANCVFTVTSDGSTSAMTTGFEIASIPYGGFMPVHITATQTAGASASTGASASASTATSTATSMVASTDASTTASTTASSTSSSSTTTAGKADSTNAAMPVITGNARWVVGGAAALALAVV